MNNEVNILNDFFEQNKTFTNPNLEHSSIFILHSLREAKKNAKLNSLESFTFDFPNKTITLVAVRKEGGEILTYKFQKEEENAN